MKRFAAVWRLLPVELWVLWLLAALTRLPGLGTPKAVVFDEVYFFQDFSGSYFTHKYFFDIHPPLGKLMIAVWAKLFGATSDTFSGFPPAYVRLLPAIAGILVVPLVYGIVRRLSDSRLAAGLAGLVVALDGALIVQSRFVLLDSFMLAFGLGAIYSALRWQEKPSWKWLLVTGALAGCTISIKWIGLAPVAGAMLILAKGLVNHGSNLKKWVISYAGVLVLAAAIYTSTFAIHFALLSRSGTGDAFMSPRFQATLQGGSNYDPSIRVSFLSKFIELNKEMFNASRTLTAGHPYGSKWYTWPLELRPIYYWQGNTLPNGSQGNIYLLGNPFGWWPATLAALLAMLMLAVSRWRRWLGPALPVIGLLLFAYLLNWLPFAAIARVMFLYHYLFAFIFSVMIMAVLVAKVMPANRRRVAVIGLAAAVVAGFIFFSPITYGWALSPSQLHTHIWLPGWR